MSSKYKVEVANCPVSLEDVLNCVPKGYRLHSWAAHSEADGCRVYTIVWEWDVPAEAARTINQIRREIVADKQIRLDIDQGRRTITPAPPFYMPPAPRM